MDSIKFLTRTLMRQCNGACERIARDVRPEMLGQNLCDGCAAKPFHDYKTAAHVRGIGIA